MNLSDRKQNFDIPITYIKHPKKQNLNLQSMLPQVLLEVDLVQAVYIID